LQANSLYTISNTTFTDAGTYPITVALNDKTNYKWEDGTTTDLTFSFVINKATYNMSIVVFADKTVTYNGTAWTEGVNYTYDPTSGLFTTLPGQITVPAAAYTQDPTSGAWSVTPGTAIISITGNV
jgi:hypothetical protein